MIQAAATSRIKHLVFVSPYFILVFLFIPAVIIVSHLLHLPYNVNLMLANNCALLVCVALRLVWYLARLARSDRYGADLGEPAAGRAVPLTPAQVRSELVPKGYRFDSAGGYGEKRDLGYLGTVILYAGLTLALLLGNYDNLCQFSGVVRLGIGDPKPLNNPQSYGELIMGPAASFRKLPMIQIRKMALPNPQWPRGSVELALWNKDGAMVSEGTSAPGRSLHYNGFEFDMLKFSYVADFRLFTRENQPVFKSVLTLLPLAVKQGVYSYHTEVSDPAYPDVTGEAWFNPERKALKVQLVSGGREIFNSEMELWGGSKKIQGDYWALFERLGEFSEVRIAHDRHFGLMKLGALVALAGALLRIAVRPQRVWLQESATGSLAKSAGGASAKTLAGLSGR